MVNELNYSSTSGYHALVSIKRSNEERMGVLYSHDRSGNGNCRSDDKRP